MDALLLVGVLFGLIGLAVLIAGVIAAFKQSRKSASVMKPTGTVVNLVSRVFNPGGAGVYCPGLFLNNIQPFFATRR